MPASVPGDPDDPEEEVDVVPEDEVVGVPDDVPGEPEAVPEVLPEEEAADPESSLGEASFPVRLPSEPEEPEQWADKPTERAVTSPNAADWRR